MGRALRRPIAYPLLRGSLDGVVAVFCVDEKSSNQALKQVQGYPNLPGGLPLAGQSHDYKRHGADIDTLFAALAIVAGKVTGRQYRRCCLIELLGSMNRTVASNPGREVHVVLDNLDTHKPKKDRWLKRHPNVRFQFTPASASWLNQFEIWFSNLASMPLAAASLRSFGELKTQIEDFVATYSDDARPFVRTKSEVHENASKQVSRIREFTPWMPKETFEDWSIILSSVDVDIRMGC